MSGQNRTTKKEAFLAAYVELGTISAAAKAAGMRRQTHYDWMNSDPEYAEQFEQAMIEAGEELEAEAIRRAVKGVEEPVFYEGIEVGRRRKYSDTLLIFLMKGLLREKYGDQIKQEVIQPLTDQQAESLAEKYGLKDWELPGAMSENDEAGLQ